MESFRLRVRKAVVIIKLDFIRMKYNNEVANRGQWWTSEEPYVDGEVPQ